MNNKIFMIIFCSCYFFYCSAIGEEISLSKKQLEREIRIKQRKEKKYNLLLSLIKDCNRIDFVYIKLPYHRSLRKLLDKNCLVKPKYVNSRYKCRRFDVTKIKKLFSRKTTYLGGLCESEFILFAFEFYQDNTHKVTLIPNLLGGDLYCLNKKQYFSLAIADNAMNEIYRICFFILGLKYKPEYDEAEMAKIWGG